jgi:Domain of unknown function (DUF5071)
MPRDDLVPSSKFDIEAAERAVARGWPDVEPVLPRLLEWLQDGNWPVARVLAPFLAGIGDPLVPYLRPILAGDDLIWKYWIIQGIIGEAPLSVVEAFRPDLERLANDPTPSEREEELPEVASAVLGRLA